MFMQLTKRLSTSLRTTLGGYKAWNDISMKWNERVLGQFFVKAESGG